MLTKEQKRKLLELMSELPKYVDEDSAQSALADLIHANDRTWETLYRAIFEKKIKHGYEHPSVYIMRFLDHQ